MRALTKKPFCRCAFLLISAADDAITFPAEITLSWKDSLEVCRLEQTDARYPWSLLTVEERGTHRGPQQSIGRYLLLRSMPELWCSSRAYIGQCYIYRGDYTRFPRLPLCFLLASPLLRSPYALSPESLLRLSQLASQGTRSHCPFQSSDRLSQLLRSVLLPSLLSRTNSVSPQTIYPGVLSTDTQA